MRVRGPGLVEALLRGGVAVLHTLAMRGVVLPLAPALPARAGAPLAVVVLDAVSSLVPVVHVVREVVRGAVVDVDVAAPGMPVAVTPQRRADRHPGREREGPGGEVARWIRVVGRVSLGECAIDDRRVIARHVDDLWIGLLDLDDGRRSLGNLHRGLGGRRLRDRRWRRRSGGLHDDLLLRGALELPVGLGACAQSLDAGHHVVLLRQERISQLL